MTVTPYLRTKDLAEAAQMSVQQVRNYEANGFIPAVERSERGYRRYTPQHLAALQTAKQLIGGYGWLRAQHIMHAIHAGRLADALAHMDARHAELDKTRLQLKQTLAALSRLTTHLTAEPTPRFTEPLRVGAAAKLVGVEISAIRFWEQMGLVHPIREESSRYRLYDESQLRRLRIVALLRQAHYDFPAIHTTLNELQAGNPQRTLTAVTQRYNTLADLSWYCVQATATFHGYVRDFLADMLPTSSAASRRYA